MKTLSDGQGQMHTGTLNLNGLWFLDGYTNPLGTSGSAYNYGTSG
jgi:hypothetical protein